MTQTKVPSDLRFTEEHEWARQTDEGLVIVGITHHAQEVLGDVVYVDLPDEEAEIEAGEEFGLVESVKATSSIYAPVSGTIRAVNHKLQDAPELLNEAPYEEGWLIEVAPSDSNELDDLLAADAYKELTDRA